MVNQVRERLIDVVRASATRSNVAAYFNSAAPPDDRFTGRLFEQFGGGGDHPAVANRFTAADLLAVESVSVQVPSDAAHEMLHGALARDLADLLAAIPLGIDLGTPNATTHLDDGSSADLAWRLLKQQGGVGWVTAGKLMARKRPRLLPVYDEVVACVLGKPDGFWLALNEALMDSALRNEVESLRPADAGYVSTLRLLDVAIWMHHQKQHREGHC